jgi:cell shape-determining protein MreC
MAISKYSTGDEKELTYSELLEKFFQSCREVAKLEKENTELREALKKSKITPKRGVQQ